VTTANSGRKAGLPFDSTTIGSGASLTWDTAHAGYRGTAALHVTTGASAVNVWGRWDNMYRPGAGVAQVATAWMYFTANPGATTTVLFVGNASAQRICDLRVTSTGRVRAVNSAGTTVVDTTNAIALNTWVRADMLFTPDAAAGVLQLKLYNNPGSATPTETTAVFTGQNLRQADPSLYLVGIANGATNISYWVQAAFTDGAAPPFGAVGWVMSRWLGAVTATSASVAARVLGASSVRLKVSTTSDLATSPVFSSAQTPDADGTVRMTVTGLAADTAYFYGIECDGVVDTEYGGSFRTAPTPGTQKSFTFCAASCAQNNSNASTFDAIRAENPSFFVHLGDLHYRDLTANDQVAYQRAYDQVMSSPRQLAFFGALPVPYIWSDHDSVGPNGDGSAASVPAANAVYRSRVPAYSNLPATTGAYFSFTWGRVKIVCTDGRSFASPITDADGPSKTKLGSTQKAWLLSELTDPTYPLIIWCHEDAISNGATFSGDDTWSAYPTERTQIFAAIAAAGARVAYICGDLHSLAADSGANVPTAGAGSGVPVHVAAAMDNTSFKGNGTYTAGVYPVADGVLVNQYGRFVVTDTGSSISLLFEGKDTSGAVRVTQTTTWTLSTPQTPAGPAGSVRVSGSAGAVTAAQAVTVSGTAGAQRLRAGAGAVSAAQAAGPSGAGGTVRLRPGSGAISAVRTVTLAGGPGTIRATAAAGSVSSAQQALLAGAAGTVRVRSSAGAVTNTAVTLLPGTPGTIRLRGSQGAAQTVQAVTATAPVASVRLRASVGTVAPAQQVFPSGAAGTIRVRSSAGAVSNAGVAAVQGA
ncbi:alkaline phosphatase D family protein, partial [Microbispora amethystogenes]|uniref:alkaline phosphatase D family protein n=1 Tax=Microbispora amethystogenes TaxID=1427754 RepID=UPI0033D412E6